MSATTAPVGRAGMDVVHDLAGASGRANRARILGESMRELDPALVVAHAGRNPNIDRTRSHMNVAGMDDGSGGWRTPASIDEVLDYGDDRIGRVRRKIGDNSFVVSRFVFTLPKTMCEPRTWTDATGATRYYWAAKDRDEAMRYFHDALDYLATVLPGGREAIHGWDANFDETTPHLQVLGDTLGADPKGTPGKDLRVMASQAWGQHRDVRDEQGHSITGPTKMRAYQKHLREYMVERGYPVVLEADPVRSRRKQAKKDFIELEERKEALVAEAEALEAAARQVSAAQEALRARETTVQAREADADAREAQTAQERAEVLQEAEKVSAAREAVEAQQRLVAKALGKIERLTQGTQAAAEAMNAALRAQPQVKSALVRTIERQKAAQEAAREVGVITADREMG